VLAGQAQQHTPLTVQQAVRRGLINLQTPLQQYLLMALLLERVLLGSAVVAVEVVVQPLLRLAQQPLRAVLVVQVAVLLVRAVLAAGLLVVVWVLAGLAVRQEILTVPAAAAVAVLAA
jgi:hypothetical protein